ncbi:MAG TPA: 2'-5' RNA ligase family protein [Streptosporangiaceae bacterium]
MAVPGPRSGLMVEVPEAEPAVARHRERLDASARLGVPAHITVLSPFMPPQAIGPAEFIRLEHLFAAFSPFRFQLDRTAWFGDEVLWLAPRDPGPFRALTRSVTGAFPAFPPYQGQFGGSAPPPDRGPRVPPDRPACGRGVRPGLPAHRRASHRSHPGDPAVR